MRTTPAHLTKLLAPLTLVAAAACGATPPEDTAAGASEALAKTPVWIDGNVASFKTCVDPACTKVGVVYVLGTDGKLWRETGNMTNRTFVDANVLDYQPIDGRSVWVLGSDHKLWRELGDMSTRSIAAVNVTSFSAVSTYRAYVVSNGTLTLIDELAGTATLLTTGVKAVQAFYPDHYGLYYVL